MLVSTASPLKPGAQLCSGVQAIARPENSLMASAVKPYFMGESHCEDRCSINMGGRHHRGQQNHLREQKFGGLKPAEEGNEGKFGVGRHWGGVQGLLKTYKWL